MSTHLSLRADNLAFAAYESSPSDANLAALFDAVAEHVRCVASIKLGKFEDSFVRDVSNRILAAIPRFQHRAAFSTFVHRIASNHCCNVIRQAARDPEPLETIESVADSRPFEHTMETHLMLNAALKSLTAEERDLLDASLDGVPSSELASQFGLTRRAIQYRITRIKQQIQRQLGGAQ